MIVSHVFTSIQGEGTLAGVPAVYACLAGGTPRVTWCETPAEVWMPAPEDMLGAVLASIRRRFTTYAVICGAEPLQVEELLDLCAGLQPLDLHVTIETSGSVYAEVPCNLMSINIRLRNPVVPRKDKAAKTAPAYDVDVVRKLIDAYNYQLKFEVADRAEMEEVQNLVREVGADRDKVVLQPLIGTAKDQKDRMPWALEASRFFGYRIVPRLPMPLPAPKPMEEPRTLSRLPLPVPFPR